MKMWYFHAVELYSALKKVEIMTILGKKKKGRAGSDKS